MLTVACVLKSGGVYDATWVARLKAGVERNLTSEHRFVCLTDTKVPCSSLLLEKNWPGWWSKIELFRIPPPVLYFDLDTLILGDLSDLVKSMRGFVMLRDFYMPTRKASGIMSWSIGSGAASIYEKFCKEPQKIMDEFRTGGDQGFIERVMPDAHVFQDMVPGQIVSYKADNCQIKAPHGARVLALHGQPKFTDMAPTSWARTMWEKAA